MSSSNNNNMMENNNSNSNGILSNGPNISPILTSVSTITPTTFKLGNNESTTSLLSGLDSFSSSGSPNGKLNLSLTPGSTSSTSSGKSKDDIRRRRQQSKSMSYSNFNSITDSAMEEFTNSEEILDICVVLKERLKQLAVQLELDLSEIAHKDQEIDLLQNRINRYNTEIRQKEEENDRLQDRIKELSVERLEQSKQLDSLGEELQQVKGNWIQPQEIDQFRSEIDVIQLESNQKDQIIKEWEKRYQESEKRIETLVEQVKKERELSVIQRQESENTHKQFKQEREQYFKEIENDKRRLEKYKLKNQTARDDLNKMLDDNDTIQRSYEKVKSQLSTAEKDNIEHRHTIEKLQLQLSDSQKLFNDLSNSQKNMTQELKHSESERLAVIGLMNRSELEIDEKILLLMSELSKSNDTISKLQYQNKDLERQLTDERLTRQITSISLSNSSYSHTERDLIRMIQEKDEEIQRLLKQIQRLYVDNNNLRSKSKSLEDNMNENSNQLQITKKSLRSSRKELSKITQELLFISNENFNDSIGHQQSGSHGSNSSFNGDLLNQSSTTTPNKRKSLDSSLFLSHSNLHDLHDDGDDDSPNISPIKTTNSMIINDNTPTTTSSSTTANRHRSLTYSSSPSRSNILSPNKSISNLNNVSSSSITTSTVARTIDQLEDMLEKARTANMGYRLHIQFLSKEVKSMELDIKQQREYTNNIVSRLNMDLEESKRLNSRIRKTFLSRFTKEEDLIFLDYYTMTDKFYKPSNFILSDSTGGSSAMSLSSSSSSSLSSSYTSPITSSPVLLTSTSSLNQLLQKNDSSPLTKQTTIINEYDSNQKQQNQQPKDQLLRSNNNVNNNNSNNNLNNHFNTSSNNLKQQQQTNNNNNNNNSSNTKRTGIVDISKHCGRCSKEFSLFTRKYLCVHCTMNYCSDCCNSKTKTCVFCTMSPK